MLPPEVSPRARYIMAAVAACVPLAAIPMVLGLEAYQRRQVAKWPTVVGEVVAFEHRGGGRRGKCGGYKPVVAFALPTDPEDLQRYRGCTFPHKTDWADQQHWIGRKVTVSYQRDHPSNVLIAEWERPIPKPLLFLFSLGLSIYLFYMVARPPRKTSPPT